MAADAEDGAKHFLKNFDNPEEVAHYADGPRRYLPGLDALHRMTSVLLAEHAPSDARVLVLGAGGGLELKALADDHPGWTFVGVDPAAQMLGLAERVASPHMDRIDLVQGYIGDAPEGPFDAATCLLTLHFLRAADREATVREIHRRLRPGAPFVAAHGSFPRAPDEQGIWLDRYAAFAIASGADPDQARSARNAIEASANMLSPEEDEAALRNGGFADAKLFWSAFTWRGWVGHA